jgi:hypothetical protein
VRDRLSVTMSDTGRAGCPARSIHSHVATYGGWYPWAVNKTTLYLSPETQRSLRDLARRTGRHQADVIREALELYLHQHGERPRPRSIGSGEDTELAARDSEDWLKSRWGSA